MAKKKYQNPMQRKLARSDALWNHMKAKDFLLVRQEKAAADRDAKLPSSFPNLEELSESQAMLGFLLA